MVIVDDGSADGTKGVAFDFVKRYTVDKVRVVLLGRNHGKGEAIRKVSHSESLVQQNIDVMYPRPHTTNKTLNLFALGSMAKQGMLHSRGELLLMLDADGATKVGDLEKLENQVSRFDIQRYFIAKPMVH